MQSIELLKDYVHVSMEMQSSARQLEVLNKVSYRYCCYYTFFFLGIKQIAFV